MYTPINNKIYCTMTTLNINSIILYLQEFLGGASGEVVGVADHAGIQHSIVGIANRGEEAYNVNN